MTDKNTLARITAAQEHAAKDRKCRICGGPTETAKLVENADGSGSGYIYCLTDVCRHKTPIQFEIKDYTSVEIPTPWDTAEALVKDWYGRHGLMNLIPQEAIEDLIKRIREVLK